VTEKPKEIRVRHKRESERMPMGVAETVRRAESQAHFPDLAAFRFMSGTFNPAACAAIIR
jgi:predicted MarR family transcription regulator